MSVYTHDNLYIIIFSLFQLLYQLSAGSCEGWHC